MNGGMLPESHSCPLLAGANSFEEIFNERVTANSSLTVIPSWKMVYPNYESYF
jgi:hypothetical protein